MGEENDVSQAQCDERIGEVYKELRSLDKSVNKILGGISVAAFVLVMCVGGVFYHFNMRFSGLSEDIKNIEHLILY